MTYTLVKYPSFGQGLNLRDQPDVISPSQALDCLDVGFTARGAVKERAGYSKFTAVEGTNQYDSLHAFYTSTGTKHLIAGDGLKLEALDTVGAILSSTTAPTASPHFFARFGSPSTEELFAANGTDQLRAWNGVAWSTPAWTGTAPTGRYVAQSAVSNRLVNARRSGSTAGDNASTVRFSAAGDPLTWGANDYVDLLPGDGEPIMGIASWRELVFVFKQTKFFVFYGEQQLSSGQPVFQYRPVSSQHGLVASNGIAIASEGVYFLDRNGVYRTSGGEPTLISDALDGLFNPLNVPTFYSGSQLNFGQVTRAALTVVNDLLYVSVPTGASTNDRVFVYHTKENWWSVYSLKAAAMCSFRVGSTDDLMFAYSSGTKNIGRHTATAVNDAGSTIPSFWSGGWWDMGFNITHVIRDPIFSGSGSLKIGMAIGWSAEGVQSVFSFPTGRIWGDGTNPADTWGDGTDPTNTWGGGAAVYDQIMRYSWRGNVFSLRFHGTGTPWQIHTLTYQLRELRIPYLVN